MSWTVIIMILLELFGPAIRKWLEELLKRSAETIQPPADDDQEFNTAIIDLFDTAEDMIPWWHFWRFWQKRAIQSAKRVVLARSTDIRARAAGRPNAIRPLTTTERVALWA